MGKAKKNRKSISAEAIARMAERGEDISRFFTNRLVMVRPIQRVNVDFAAPMLAELDDAAEELNISRQAIIKTLVREGLDRRHVHAAARRKRKPAAPNLPRTSRSTTK